MQDLSSENKNAHFLVNSEEEAFNKVRELFSFIPDNNLTDADILETTDLNKINSNISSVLSNEQYDIRDIIKDVSDDNRFFELFEEDSNSIICGFVRIGGRSTGIVANCIANKKMLDSKSFNKASRFVRFCDAFNIPVVTFIDTYGIIDEDMVMKHGAKLFYAYAEATVPKINLILKNAFGGSYVLMGGLNADMSYALEISQISTSNPASMAVILNNDKINNFDEKNKIVEEYKTNETLPIMAVNQNVVDEVIKPENIRQKLISALYLFAGKRENRPVKKHGNIPL